MRAGLSGCGAAMGQGWELGGCRGAGLASFPLPCAASDPDGVGDEGHAPTGHPGPTALQTPGWEGASGLCPGVASSQGEGSLLWLLNVLE